MIKKLILPLALIACAAISTAQGFGGGGGGQGGGMRMMGGGGSPTMMLTREDVQADLALSDDQKVKLQAISGSMRDRMMEMFQNGGIDPQEMRTPEGREKMQKMMKPMIESIEKETLAVLTAEQNVRLIEVFVQVSGNRAVQNEKIGTAIAVTDDQKEKMKVLTAKSGEAMRGLFQKVQSGEMTMEEIGEARKKNDAIMDIEIGKILTEVQRAKLKTMGGTKKFVPSAVN